MMCLVEQDKVGQIAGFIMAGDIHELRRKVRGTNWQYEDAALDIYHNENWQPGTHTIGDVWGNKLVLLVGA